MAIQWKKLIIHLAIPLAVGGLATLLSGGMREYGQLQQPPLSPPGWVFGVVWTVLYLLMGYSAYLVSISNSPHKKKALTVYYLQLAANFIWPLLFFSADAYLLSFLWILVLWGLIFWTIRSFSRVDERAADLLIPYILWVSFAAYLNFGVYLLN